MDSMVAMPVDGPWTIQRLTAVSLLGLFLGDTMGLVTRVLFGGNSLSPLRTSVVGVILPLFLTHPYAVEYLFCRKKSWLRYVLFPKYP